jgi:hypothetical protein
MDGTDSVNLAVIIPVRNESKIIEVLYKNIDNFIKNDKKYTFILALDNCTDDTINILNRITQNKKILIIESESSPGYGNIVRFAFTKASSLGFEWAVVIDSDLSSPLTEIPKIMQIILRNRNPKIVIIKGNRFNNVRPDFIGVPIKRLILSKTANQFTRILGSNNSKDLTNGFRAVNLAWFISQNLKESGFSSIIEEAYKAISTGNLILDFQTSLRYDKAIRLESSFSFNPKLILSYSKYAVKLWGISLRRKIKM